MRSRGFSLIELLIVIAIILVIAAIAVPRYLDSKMSANEASAVASLHAINTAESTYAVSYPDVGYANNLSKLGPAVGAATSVNAGLVDGVLGCTNQPCSKSGYAFAIMNTSGSPVDTYLVVGTPLSVGRTGRFGYCSDKANQITVDQAGGTNCSSPVAMTLGGPSYRN